MEARLKKKKDLCKYILKEESSFYSQDKTKQNFLQNEKKKKEKSRGRVSNPGPTDYQAFAFTIRLPDILTFICHKTLTDSSYWRRAVPAWSDTLAVLNASRQTPTRSCRLPARNCECSLIKDESVFLTFTQRKG